MSTLAWHGSCPLVERCQSLGTFFAHLVYSANPFVPDARSETEEAIKPRRPLFVPWNGGRLASPRSSARSLALPLLGRFALRIFAPPSLVHVPTLAAGISKSDNEGGEDEETRVGRIFVAALFSRRDRQPRISGEYISVALRTSCSKKSGSLQSFQSCGYFGETPSFVSRVGDDGVHASQLHN